MSCMPIGIFVEALAQIDGPEHCSYDVESRKVARMAKKRVPTSKDEGSKKSAPKRPYYKQSDFPLTSLQQAQKIASAIVDNFAGDGGSPPDVALALGISPTSS